MKNLSIWAVPATILIAAFVFATIGTHFTGNNSLFLYDSGVTVSQPSHILASPSNSVDGDQLEEESSEVAQEYVINYEIVQGEYAESRFALTLPDGMTGYLWRSNDNDDYMISRDYMTIQIHPGFISAQSCMDCPAIDEAPAVMLLNSGPMDSVATVPFAGDIYAAVQGYNMKMDIDTINGVDVFVATLSAENRESPGKHTGKFYIMNDGNDRFISYGLWADESKYSEYIDEFEASAKSIRIQNATAISLKSIYGQYFATVPDIVLDINNSSVIVHPELISRSTIERVDLNPTTNTLTVSVDGASMNRQFLIVNTGELLSGPHIVLVNGQPADSTVLRSGSEEFLFVVYGEQDGPTQVTLTGTAVVPEFGSAVVMVSTTAAGIAAVIVAGRKAAIIKPRTA